jgi:hypothetical protein
VNRRHIGAVFILLALAAGAYVLVTGTGGSGDYARVLVLDMTVTDGGVSPPSAEIRYGHPPATDLRAGTLTGTLVTADGRTVRSFSVWDPRVQLGDTVTDNGEERLSGFMTTGRSAPLHLVLPYTGEEAGFRLAEKTTGRTLAKANLSDAAAAFAETYPQDPAVVAAREGSRIPLPKDPQVLMAEVGVVLFLALVLLSITMVRKKRD